MNYRYQDLYEKNAAFFHARPTLKRALKYADIALTLFFVFAYAALWIYALSEELSATKFLPIVFVPMLGAFVVAILRIAIDRPRPYAPNGAGIVPLVEKKGTDGNSFPSRHLTCAFVIATTFLPYIPVAGILLYLLGLCLGYVRFALGWHYPSDLLGGAAIGALVGCLVFFL